MCPWIQTTAITYNLSAIDTTVSSIQTNMNSMIGTVLNHTCDTYHYFNHSNDGTAGANAYNTYEYVCTFVSNSVPAVWMWQLYNYTAGANTPISAVARVVDDCIYCTSSNMPPSIHTPICR